MNLPIIAVRPEPALSQTVTIADAMGLPVQPLALSRALPTDWTAPDPAGFDAILAGSANVFRHGGTELEKLRALRVLAVGQRTAEAAQAASFVVQTIGEGGLQTLIDNLDEKPRRILRLSARDHVSLTWPHYITATTCITYQMEPLSLTMRDADTFLRGGVILLYSAQSAAHFCRECERLNLDKSGIIIAALGPRIASAAGTGWRAVHASAKPAEAELLALARGLWQSDRNASSGGGVQDQKS